MLPEGVPGGPFLDGVRTVTLDVSCRSSRAAPSDCAWSEV